MGKYKLVQIPEETHAKLKNFCERHDKKMGKTIAKLVDTHLWRTMEDSNILRTK